MTTVAKNHRYIELLTVENAAKAIDISNQTIGGWKGSRDVEYVDADGDDNNYVVTSSSYADTIYGSNLISRPEFPLGSLIGFWSSGDILTLNDLTWSQLNDLTWLQFNDLVWGHATQESTSLQESTPFLIGNSWYGDIPIGLSELVIGFHDSSQWNNNYGSISVVVTFDGSAPLLYTVHASQCIYFRWSPMDLLGPSPYYEAIDEGYRGNPHRPSTISIPVGATKLSIEVDVNIKQTTSGNESSYYKIQRYLFDPAKYDTLLVRELLWKRGYQIADFHTFLLQNGRLNNVPFTYCLSHLADPIVVAIKKTVTGRESQILDALNRRWTTPSTAVNPVVLESYNGSPNYDIPLLSYVGKPVL